MDERTLARRAVELIEDRKGEDVVVIDLADVSIPTSYFVIATADNPVHTKALVNALRAGISESPRHSEGTKERKWIVLDYGDIVVHLFDREAREFYDIESLWADHIVDRRRLEEPLETSTEV
jgi:ribosome-associated protein